MMEILLICRDAAEAAASLASLLPQLGPGERVVMAGRDRSADRIAALRRLAGAHPEAPVDVLGRREHPADVWTRDFVLVLRAPGRLRAGGLRAIRAALKRRPQAPWLRVPAPGAQAELRLARRRLFGLPLRIAWSDPLLLSRASIAELPRRGLLASLAGRSDRLWLAMERHSDGLWLEEPVLDARPPVAVPGASTGRHRRLLTRRAQEAGLPVSVRSERGGLRVLAERPRGIDIELTNRCNAGCCFCPRHEIPELGDMSDEVFERVLAFVREQSIGTIYFIGRGEPMLHPRFVEYIQRIKQVTGLEFEVFTNGLRLTPDLVQRLAELNDPELNIAINVSLHSLQAETHRRLTGTSLEKIARNLEHLVQQRDRLRVSYAFVTNKINEREMAGLRRHLDATGNTAWDISLVYNKGGFVPEGPLFDEAFFQRQANWDPATRRSPTGPCWYSYSGQFYWVNFRGQFTLCHDDFREDTILGRVGETSLEEVDRRVADLRAAGGAPRCARCNKRLREWHHGENVDGISGVKGSFLIPPPGEAGP